MKFRLVIARVKPVNTDVIVHGRVEIERGGAWEVCGVFQLRAGEWPACSAFCRTHGIEVDFEALPPYSSTPAAAE
jgi:hypothetical protein